jgi:hypothetical protein
VLWVFALQFLFYFRVGFFPEGVEVGGDLDGAVIGGEDLDYEGDAAVSYEETFVYSV